MLNKENIDKNVADEVEKCVNGINCKNGIVLIITVVLVEFDDISMVSSSIVSTNSIRNVCNFNRTSKYGIERNSVNAANTRMIK